jgi:hypothetical protein
MLRDAFAAVLRGHFDCLGRYHSYCEPSGTKEADETKEAGGTKRLTRWNQARRHRNQATP